VRGQHNKVSAEEAIAAIKRQGDDDADALSAQDEAVIAQLFSQRATQVWSRPSPAPALIHCPHTAWSQHMAIQLDCHRAHSAGSLHQSSNGMRSTVGACLVVVNLSSAWPRGLFLHCCFR
jgi:hypothetical protein